MQSPSIDACKTFRGSIFQLQLTDYRSISSFSSPRRRSSYPCVSCNFNDNNGPSVENQRKVAGVRAKGKENVWSIDNEMAKEGKEKERMMRRKKKGGKRVRTVNRRVGKVMVSGSMLVEVETVLQTQEPVIRPAWRTFASSVSGIWKGVGAVYSPITAEMEPVEIGGRNENLFDCYTLSHIEAVPSTCEVQSTQLHRKVNWVPLNPYGETKSIGGVRGNKKHDDTTLPKIESFDFGGSYVMEEDVIAMEPGLVFFEDGSYSRGPVDIPIGELDETRYYISPTFKFEQCLVKGCHKRLRLVHTIEFSNGGSDIQIMRVAVYEEEWVSPSHIPDCSELELDLKPFSRRKRVQPSELTGSWKVFEVSATPIYGEDLMIEEGNGAPYVYLCTENLNKRSLPENPVYFGEEEMVDMQDVTVLWLPGGVTAYVDVKDGVLCIGVGWYSDDGINLVMERDYGLDGKFREVRWKSEMKRRWTNPPSIEQTEGSIDVGLDEKIKRRVLLTSLVGPIMAPALPSFGKTKKQNPYDERRLLEQNKRIQRENNAPDEFPNFVREGFTVKVVASENYVTRDSGLILRDISVGQGECPKAGQQVTFHYVGYNESGRRIDSTYIQGSPAKVRLGNNALIPGFEEGIRDMKPGGKRRLIIPPELGPPVGPSTFFSSKQFEVFDVELLSIEDCTRRTIGFYSDVVCG